MTTIAFLTASEGIEKAELVEPWQAVLDAGHEAVLLSPESGEVQLFEHLDKAETRSVDKEVGSASIDDYDALFIRDFVASGKPVAAICHAPWTLVEAGVLEGRTLTSWPSLQTDIRNAGGTWVDEPVVTDGNLITSRNPDDIPSFNNALLEAVAHGAGSTGS
jgi:protease I